MPIGTHINSRKAIILYNVQKKIQHEARQSRASVGGAEQLPKIDKENIRKIIDKLTDEQLKEKGVTHKIIKQIQGGMFNDYYKEKEEAKEQEYIKLKNREDKKEVMKKLQNEVVDLAETLNKKIEDILELKRKYDFQVDEKVFHAIAELQKIQPSDIETTKEFFKGATHALKKGFKRLRQGYETEPKAESSIIPIGSQSATLSSVSPSITPQSASSSSSSSVVANVQLPITTTTTSETTTNVLPQHEAERLQPNRIDASNLFAALDMMGQVLKK